MRIFFFLCSTFFSCLLTAQKNTVTTGGEIKNNTGSVSFSIGLIDFKSFNNGTASISQGVQQTYQVQTTPIGEDLTHIKLNVFPNPTSSQVQLSIEDKKSMKHQYTLSTLDGKLLRSAKINSPLTTIDLLSYPESNYVLTVYYKNQIIKSFNILKL